MTIQRIVLTRIVFYKFLYVIMSLKRKRTRLRFLLQIK